MALQSISKGYAQSNIQHEQLAQQLSEWGLFSGTGKGFELEREATRAEAVVMLLRLLGQEQQAEEQFSSNIAHPFQDVPPWANPYISYAYTHKLTTGTSENRFGSHEPVTVKQYFTFILRALGYSDAEDGQRDFVWQQSIEKAAAIGMTEANPYLDGGLGDRNLIRDQLVHISYHALHLPAKGGTSPLLHQLIPEQTEIPSGVIPEPSELLLPVQAFHTESEVTGYYVDADVVKTQFPNAVSVEYATYTVLKNDNLSEEEAMVFDGLRMGLWIGSTLPSGNKLDSQYFYMPVQPSWNDQVRQISLLYDDQNHLIAYALQDGARLATNQWVIHTQLPQKLTELIDEAQQLHEKAYYFPAEQIAESDYQRDIYGYFYESGQIYDALGEIPDEGTRTFLLDQDQSTISTYPTYRLNTSGFPAAAQQFTMYALRYVVETPEDPIKLAKQAAYHLQLEYLILDYLHDEYEILQHHPINTTTYRWYKPTELSVIAELADAHPYSVYVFLVNDEKQVVAYTFFPART